MVAQTPTFDIFQDTAESILSLKIAHRVNSLGGYGYHGEVIYENHPWGCPSTLTTNLANATATFTSNGSVDFEVKLENGMPVHILENSFDGVEKRETGPLSTNLWLTIRLGDHTHIASLINPRFNWNLPARNIKIVKTGDPERALWYCTIFTHTTHIHLTSAVCLRLVRTRQGPALSRRVYIKNTGAGAIQGNLWSYFDLHGTQRFVYHKRLWYDAGAPIDPHETLIVATVPHEDSLQIKRVSSHGINCTAEESTCDYTTFIGDSGTPADLPEAVLRGGLLDQGAKTKLNRFATASISATRFALQLDQGQSASLVQALLYIDEPRTIRRFKRLSSCSRPGYKELEVAFRSAAQDLLEHTPGAFDIEAIMRAATRRPKPPAFEVSLPSQPAVSAYLNSLWTGVQELYEKCRAHGAQLADGIEVGTRDRSQDMWPKMKEDPRRVRADLLHALSFMYRTFERPPSQGERLSLAQKLHGMFPRQIPSRWLDRTSIVYNDNRPYSDSPLWLVEALLKYLCETGDTSILVEEVNSIHLSDPEHPEISGILGAQERLTIYNILCEIFAAYQRHIQDSPYKLAQILFGDWCDPVDMYGTSTVGDPKSRGKGRGAQVRLSAHLFLCLVKAIDVLSSKKAKAMLDADALERDLAQWKELANQLRKSILKVTWEDGLGKFSAGFIDCIHELNKDGSRPDYAKGEIGYTLGSMKGKDFDGINRRLLTTQAYCLEMLRIQRVFLDRPAGSELLVQKILKTVDRLFFRPRLGLALFSTPVANGPLSVSRVGRIGIVPPGCAENGEYHHAQMFMHLFRLNLAGQSNRVWEQFIPILSVSQDETIGGPFDMTSNSYVSDVSDPHYGKGMYFGLSGSIDWIIELVQNIAGLELALHDDELPDIRICPNLPDQLQGQLTFKRLIHKTTTPGEYRTIPLTIQVDRQGTGNSLHKIITKVNGKYQPTCEIWDASAYSKINVQIIMNYR